RTWLQAVGDLEAATGRAPRSLRTTLVGRMNTLSFTFRMLLPEFLLCFKNPAYREEQEWRLIQFGRVNEKEIIKPEFRASGGQIVPYAVLDLTPPAGKYRHKLPIQTVRFGPTLDREF